MRRASPDIRRSEVTYTRTTSPPKPMLTSVQVASPERWEKVKSNQAPNRLTAQLDDYVRTSRVDNNNVAHELRFELKKREAELAAVRAENRELKRDAEALQVARVRLEEAEGERRRQAQQEQFAEGSLRGAKAENERLAQRNAELQRQVNAVLREQPGRFRYDAGGERVCTREEYELRQENEELRRKAAGLEKERDRYYVENYEFKKLHGLGPDNLDDTLAEAAQQQYSNSLQVAELKAAQLERRLKHARAESEVLQRELNVLRSLDVLDEEGLKRELNRPAARADGRHAAAAARQRGPRAAAAAPAARGGGVPAAAGRDRHRQGELSSARTSRRSSTTCARRTRSWRRGSPSGRPRAPPTPTTPSTTSWTRSTPSPPSATGCGGRCRASRR